MRARPRAHADRLADVDDLARRVAHHVDAGVVGQVGEVGLAPARATRPRRRRRWPSPARAAGARGARARAPRAPWSRGRTAAGTARRRRARRSRRRPARGGRPRPRSPATRPAPRSRRWRASGCSRRASATVHSCGGFGQRRPARSKAWRSTRRSNDALWATSTRPRSCAASSGSCASAGGASSTIACVMPVKRWMPRESGARTVSSVSQRSCSSPPPDEHGAHLGELAGVAGQPVRLGVDDEELRGGDGLIEIHPDRGLYASHPTERQRPCRPVAPAAGAGVQSRCAPRSGRRQRMTTSAIRQGTDRTIAEREAWEAYRESLRDLEGADYEEAERASWARLQATLRELHAAARPTERQISSERRRPVDASSAISTRVRGRPHERPGRLETDADEAHGGVGAARGRGSAGAGRLREQLGGLQERPAAAGPDRHHRLHRRPARVGLPAHARRRPDLADRHQPDRRGAARDARERRRDGLRARASGRSRRRSARRTRPR